MPHRLLLVTLLLAGGATWPCDCTPTDLEQEFPNSEAVFVGRVTGGAATEGQPLVYYRGGYADLAP